MKNERSFVFNSARRIVVKVGSNVLTQNAGLNLKAIRAISRQISRLIDAGLEVILITSGAMASGIRKIGLTYRPDEIPKRQAIAAVGQAGLILEYEKAFAKDQRKVAQILLTSEDLNHRQRYLNARNTIHTLLSWKVIPIINENDTIRVEEIKLGDNDNLAAMIALLMDADILINLTDIDGLYDKDPRTYSDAKLISEVSTYKRQLEAYASAIPGALGTGGMLSKIKAARKVTSAGIPMIIAKGDKRNILINLYQGKPLGTYFVPKAKKMASRKSWIAYTLKPKGNLVIDNGACKAILNNGKSLLPGGIIQVIGEFRAGAPVQIMNSEQNVLAHGLVNYGAAEIRKIMGLKSGQIKECLGDKPYDEVIHRDNLVVTLV
ncbi:MAG: glutamate 5-kinase [Desulfobacteraceae bacterium]|jgi:glutamate 5-kinase